MEASTRALSESLSHAMWLLSGLLGFVRLQGFSPSDSPLFNTLVTSILKCLAHQASISASHTAFVGLQRRQFYLLHLPAYFSAVHECAMLAAPLVCADSLFAEFDISRLLSDTQTSSSLRSQQALVDVASNRSGGTVLGVAGSALPVLCPALRLCGVTVGSLTLPHIRLRGSGSTLWLLFPL